MSFSRTLSGRRCPLLGATKQEVAASLDKSRISVPLTVGNSVLCTSFKLDNRERDVGSKFLPKFTGPFIITKLMGNNTVLLSHPGATREYRKSHMLHLKYCATSVIPCLNPFFPPEFGLLAISAVVAAWPCGFALGWCSPLGVKWMPPAHLSCLISRRLPELLSGKMFGDVSNRLDVPGDWDIDLRFGCFQNY
ncbi:hypothetical protein PR048_026744 [Dryococelus australis]|uniref:Uncharacterized protein n=1 Tax=Dryococelus australis TaxID=614101 RepID=A0ABQ9GMA3_9NEOP|nr:hypothetical protein PR048_026744 [Dryococelus australis]